MGFNDIPIVGAFQHTVTQKPPRGSRQLAREKEKAALRTHEKDEKAKVVDRDGAAYCRIVPNCTGRLGLPRYETAHLDDKGIGGDHGLRTIAALMVRACWYHHQGPFSLHSKDLRVEFLTAEQANGPIQTMARDEHDAWYVLGRETAVGCWEHD